MDSIFTEFLLAMRRPARRFNLGPDMAAAPNWRRIATGNAMVGVIALLAGCGGGDSTAPAFSSGNLVVSRTTYTGTASTVAIGQVLPGGGTAPADGSFPNVFKNEVPDPSFGVSSPVFLALGHRAENFVCSV